MSSQLSPTAHIIWTFEVMALLAALLRFYFDTRGYAETIYPCVLEAAEVCHYLFLHPAFFPRLSLTPDASHPAGSPPLFLPPPSPPTPPPLYADVCRWIDSGACGSPWLNRASAEVALKPQTAQWHRYLSPWRTLALSPTVPHALTYRCMWKNCRFSNFKPLRNMSYWLLLHW